MVQCANVGYCQQPPFSESIRNDGFVPGVAYGHRPYPFIQP